MTDTKPLIRRMLQMGPGDISMLEVVSRATTDDFRLTTVTGSKNYALV